MKTRNTVFILAQDKVGPLDISTCDIELLGERTIEMSGSYNFTRFFMNYYIEQFCIDYAGNISIHYDLSEYDEKHSTCKNCIKTQLGWGEDSQGIRVICQRLQRIYYIRRGLDYRDEFLRVNIEDLDYNPDNANKMWLGSHVVVYELSKDSVPMSAVIISMP